jgi:hypothetical protein
VNLCGDGALGAEGRPCLEEGRLCGCNEPGECSQLECRGGVWASPGEDAICIGSGGSAGSGAGGNSP